MYKLVRTEKTITSVVETDVYCRPMDWAVVKVASPRLGDEYVIAQFNTIDDALVFATNPVSLSKLLPSQSLEVRKITKI